MTELQLSSPYIIELAPTLEMHWYSVWKKSKKGGKGKFLGYFPSATTILRAYPQSAHLTRWVAEMGWNESQRIKSEAGEAGTKIHTASDLLEDGAELDQKNYSLEEWLKIDSFVRWHDQFNPVLIAKEFPVFSSKGKYAGRLDRIYTIAGEITLLDIKSSSAIHPHFPLQFAAYAHALEENTDLKIVQTACIQLGAQNKDRFRFVAYPEWREHYGTFEHVRATWQYDQYDARKNPKDPPVLDLPATLKLSTKE